MGFARCVACARNILDEGVAPDKMPFGESDERTQRYAGVCKINKHVLGEEVQRVYRERLFVVVAIERYQAS